MFLCSSIVVSPPALVRRRCDFGVNDDGVGGGAVDELDAVFSSFFKYIFRVVAVNGPHLMPALLHAARNSSSVRLSIFLSKLEKN